MPAVGTKVRNKPAREKDPRRSGKAIQEGDVVATLLDAAVASGNHNKPANALVDILRTPDYCVIDLLRDVAEAKKRAGLADDSVLDRLVTLCIERTALVHETAIENMLHGFCELDEAGRVVYANPALLDLLPDCEGQELAPFFDDDADFVRATLKEIGGQRASRLELCGKGGHRPVLAEFGPVTRGRVAAYAFITDLTEEMEAQRRIYDKAEFGILRLDPERYITYANESACRLLHTTPDAVVGRNAADFVKRSADAERMAYQLERRQEGVSTEYDVELVPLDSSPPIHVRVRSMPETDLENHLSGMFVTLAPIELEMAAERIKADIAHAWKPDEMFASILDHVRGIVPFSYATLSVSTPDLEHCRLLRAVPPLQAGERWIPMPASVRHLLTVDFSCGPDMQSFLRETPDRADLEANTTVQELLDSGLRSWFSLRARGPDADAILTLMDEGVGSYDEETAEKVEKLGLRHAVHAVLKLDADNESLFQFDLVKKMAQAHSDRELAALVVTELARFYGWQNVAVIKVNAHEGRFELLEQAAAMRQGYSLPEGYTQPLHTGFLGMAHDENRIVLVGDSQDPEIAKNYRRASDLTRSEMCVPIRVEGKVVWILNLEDQRPHAFKNPDCASVGRLMEELEPSLERALSAALLDQVLDDAPDGIVITDFAGTIVKCNQSAAAMLGMRAEGKCLADFFPEGSKGADIASRGRGERTVPVEATLIARNGAKTEVLMRTSIPRDEYERRVVIFQDRRKVDLQAETRRLAEVTSEARVPLSLVSTFIRQISRKAAVTAPNLASLADHAIAQLGRVELTYDRVIGNAGGPARRRKVDVVAVVSRVVEALPPHLRDLIRVDGGPAIPLVRTDPEQLKGAIESMAAYLLRVADAEGPVSVRIRAAEGAVTVRMFKPRLETASVPRSEEAMKAATWDEAQARGALDEPRLYQMAAVNGGRFSRRRSGRGETLRLTLRAQGGHHV